MKIVGSLVMRNESDRYLEDVLHHHLSICDEIVVYDDRSDDDSVEIAERLGCTVHVRKFEEPSFLEHEGRFRQTAWDLLNANDGDWIFSFDADEFLVANADAGRELRSVATKAAQLDLLGVVLEIPEVFALRPGGVPMVRRDGYWRSIKGVRLVAWKPGGRFLDREMGCGSVPLYVNPDEVSRQSEGLSLLHYGYAEYEDRIEKYQRYVSVSQHGHNERHIQSILTEPQLQVWPGSYPCLSAFHG